MAETKRYRVTANGHETVMKLTAKDAEAYDGAELADAPATANSPESSLNTDQADDQDDEQDTDRTEQPKAAASAKSRTTRNKARTAQNKTAEDDGGDS